MADLQTLIDSFTDTDGTISIGWEHDWEERDALYAEAKELIPQLIRGGKPFFVGDGWVSIEFRPIQDALSGVLEWHCCGPEGGRGLVALKGNETEKALAKWCLSL